VHEQFDATCRTLGAPGLAAGEFLHSSPWLNLALYPSELDYDQREPLPATWHTLQASVREGEARWPLPDGLADTGAPLVYLSLGSLGSADLPLMRRLVEELARTDYRVVVSKGPLHDELELPPGMVGEEFLPQTSVLPAVDAVITHGGNNTVTECLYFGKPMVVLPLFWDQHDNAQRIDETGFGRRLPTYQAGATELAEALDGLLGRPELAARLAETSARLQAAPGTAQAADLLEQLASTREPVVRR
jgi:MGT family glycosyltransferase